MNRINQLFNSNKKDILSIYFCAGTPTLDGTADVIRTLEKHGVSMIEIGIPFSDPMADGIVIQNAATQALRNGMSLKLLFEQLRDIRKDVKIPLVLMGYCIYLAYPFFAGFRCDEHNHSDVIAFGNDTIMFLVGYSQGRKNPTCAYGIFKPNHAIRI